MVDTQTKFCHNLGQGAELKQLVCLGVYRQHMQSRTKPHIDRHQRHPYYMSAIGLQVDDLIPGIALAKCGTSEVLGIGRILSAERIRAAAISSKQQPNLLWVGELRTQPCGLPSTEFERIILKTKVKSCPGGGKTAQHYVAMGPQEEVPKTGRIPPKCCF